MSCRSPAANISSSLTPRTGARARPAAQSHRRVPGGASQSCLPPGEARSLHATDNWLTRQFTIEYDALFDGLLLALDRLELPNPAWWDLKSFPRIGVQMADGLAAWQFATNPFT
jgi:hypothetical protein